MGSKTKIIVLHMKEIIYTGIFLALGILLIFLLAVMFGTGRKTDTNDVQKRYHPGVYTSSFSLNNTQFEVEVTVDDSEITSIRFSNVDDSVAAMFPLVQPAIEDIAEQVCESQSLEGIALSEETPYTSQIILDAVANAVEKAAVN